MPVTDDRTAIREHTALTPAAPASQSQMARRWPPSLAVPQQWKVANTSRARGTAKMRSPRATPSTGSRNGPAATATKLAEASRLGSAW